LCRKKAVSLGLMCGDCSYAGPGPCEFKRSSSTTARFRHGSISIVSAWLCGTYRAGLRIRSIFGRIRILQIRILKPDPDPAFKKSTFFLSRIFFAWFMTKKNKKMSPEVSTFRNFCCWEVFSCQEIWKFEKAQFTNNGVIQLYIAREGSGGKLSDPDPAKRSGSGSATRKAVTTLYMCVQYARYRFIVT